MNVFKQILNFYINSSIHVALAVFSMAWITLMDFNLSYDANVLYFIFYASITGYNFVKFFGIAKFHHRSLTTWLKLIQIFSLICFILMCYYGVMLEESTMLYIAGFGLITFLYAIPFLPTRFFRDEKNNLRSIAGLKVYLIALVWSGVTVFLPLLNNTYHINQDVLITGAQRFLFVIILMLPFEIRDLQFDSLKLATIPQKIGVKRTKIMGFVLGMLFFFLEFFKDDAQESQVESLLIITIISILFVVFSKKGQGKYYCSFWVEGIPVLWLLLYLIVQGYFL
ncbi:hypothetical protein [Yeosuana marina]|uniref:hypothetical protein n=1 Tax=Yeosuana marina TaxID=1565536 RepID=UPI0030EC7147|tara:strand:+ start:1507 stop:2352 length:846 start_codon:yes stop_codon:yes gene_type:complete